MSKTQDMYKKAKTIIPGGTQLLSKRPEQFLPNIWPAYYEKAKGCKVWDLDGKEYIDTSFMGIGANVIGYADDEIDEAVMRAVRNGSMCTLNAPEEVSLAESLLSFHPWAQMVRYAKTGGEALAIAVRIARAYTKKDIVLFCGYHGWSDWYLSANLNEDDALDGHLLKGLEPKGVPRGLMYSAQPFHYNDINAFKGLLKKNCGKVAAVVLESVRNIMPQQEFLDVIQNMARQENIVLIMDEVSAGFRLNCGGAHMVLGIEPDIAVFAKALGNGYPMSAIIGKKEVMDSAQSTFISSTYWTERAGLCAAGAVIKKYQREKIENHLEYIGKKVQQGWRQLSEKYQLKLHVSGIYPLSHFDFISEHPLVLKTLFTQEMLKRGYLATNAFYSSYAHTDNDINGYLQAVSDVFEIIRKAEEENKSEFLLESSICQSGFQRLT